MARVVKGVHGNWKKGLSLEGFVEVSVYEGLPSEVHSLLLEDFQMDDGLAYLKALPLTRRKRKTLMNSNNWVIGLYMGENPSKDPLKMIQMSGKVVLEVDMEYSRLWDIHMALGEYRLLLWAAVRGKISDVVSSLPDRTWPTGQTPRRGPDAQPMRTMRAPYGREGLNPLQRQQVHRETACVAKRQL